MDRAEPPEGDDEDLVGLARAIRWYDEALVLAGAVAVLAGKVGGGLAVMAIGVVAMIATRLASRTPRDEQEPPAR